MYKAQKIDEFVRYCTNELSLSHSRFFEPYSGKGLEGKKMDWITEDGEVNTQAIAYAGEVLGIDEKDILSANKNVVAERLERYPYLKYVRPFNTEYLLTYDNKDCPIEQKGEYLLSRIFDTDYKPAISPFRYDKDDIIRRLCQQLKEMDKSLPGAYHEGASINDPDIRTRNFCRFAQIEPMVKSYVDMVKQATDMFFRVVRGGELEKEEQNEYNFLVSLLGMRDINITYAYLYYNNLLKVRELYAALTEDNFRSTIIFRNYLQFKPWRCSDFVNNEELVAEYLSVMPMAKGDMREYALESTHFKCWFVWSDAKPVSLSPDEEWEDAYLDELFGNDFAPEIPVERVKEPTEVYVKKTDEELGEDKTTAKKLASYCHPEKLGGMPIAWSALDYNDADDHIDRLKLWIDKVPRNHDYFTGTPDSWGEGELV